MAYRDDICDHIKKNYRAEPEYLWMRYPNYAVFRRADNQKWFALIMDVPRCRLGLPGSERVDIINLKMSDPITADFLASQPGYMRGYHISRGNWISVLLDGTVPLDEIYARLRESFAATATKRKRGGSPDPGRRK